MYELVLWPESQQFMEHPKFREECHLCNDGDMDNIGNSAYFIPIWLYKEITGVDLLDIHAADVD